MLSFKQHGLIILSDLTQTPSEFFESYNYKYNNNEKWEEMIERLNMEYALLNKKSKSVIGNVQVQRDIRETWIWTTLNVR
jgi:hypothetical protein